MDKTFLTEYSRVFDLLDAYDHQTLTLPEGTYYEGFESLEETAAKLLYTMIKEKEICDGSKSIAATRFLMFLEQNDALVVDGKRSIDDATLTALTVMIEKLRPQVTV